MTNQLTKDRLVKIYPSFFEGTVGKLSGTLHLQVDPTVEPTRQPLRRIPLAMQSRLKDELERLERLLIIKREDEPTDWQSSLTLVQKPNGKLRVCIDPKPLNKALKRSRYLMPTLDDFLPELTEAKIISVLDVKNGFWHIELDKSSSKLTTFGTPYGRYRWNRMPFGIAPAPEIFQRWLDSAVQGIPGIYTVADDILVIGKGIPDTDARKDHDATLITLLNRCKEKGLLLNAAKCKIATDKVTHMGHVLTSSGLKPDPDKVEAIKKMPDQHTKPV